MRSFAHVTTSGDCISGASALFAVVLYTSVENSVPTPIASSSKSKVGIKQLSITMTHNNVWKLRYCTLILILVLISNEPARISAKDAWEKPGCHKVGHTRKISIADCVEFHITTNACRGFCESWSVPSAVDTVKVNPNQAITSVGQCCNIMDTEDVEVRVMCLEGTRDLVFKSAKTCSCYHCKKD